MVGFQSIRAQTEIRVEQVTWIDNRNLVVTVRELGASTANIESVSIKKSQSGIPGLIPVNTSIPPCTVDEVPLVLSTMTLENSTSNLIRVTTTTGFYYEYTSFTRIINLIRVIIFI